MSLTRALFVLTLSVAALVCAFATSQHRYVIYNASPSAPVGFYVRTERAARIGDWVTLRVPQAASDYAATREFGDRTDRFIKRIAAGAGQTVCGFGQTVVIDGHPSVRRETHDSLGAPLPMWDGCRFLAADEVLLLGRTDDSFDGRYWGPTRIGEIDGVWRFVGVPRAWFSDK